MKALPTDFTLEKYGLYVRLVQETDAEFIHMLRTNPKNSPFMHTRGCSVFTQTEWIKKYKERENIGKEYYFIFYFNGQPVGVIRLYNIVNKEFHCGSWVFKAGLPHFCSVVGAIIAREIAFETLELEVEQNYNDGIVSNNYHVLKFMTLLGFEKQGERAEDNILFINGVLTKEKFNFNKSKVLRFVPKEFQTK